MGLVFLIVFLSPVSTGIAADDKSAVIRGEFSSVGSQGIENSMPQEGFLNSPFVYVWLRHNIRDEYLIIIN